MLGDRIREARKKASLTQAELAEKIGVKRSVISKYENGSISPTHDTILNIAKALNIFPHELYDDYQWMGYNEKFATDVASAFGLLLSISADEETSFIVKKAIKVTFPNLEDICEQLPGLVANITTASITGKEVEEISPIITSFAKGASLPADKSEKLLLYLFHILNEKGRAAAIERIFDLTDIPRYRKDCTPSDASSNETNK